MEDHRVIYIECPEERAQLIRNIQNKYMKQSLEDKPFMMDTPEKEQEVLNDIQFILNENISMGAKLFLLNEISALVDGGIWSIF